MSQPKNKIANDFLLKLTDPEYVSISEDFCQNPGDSSLNSLG